jgi:DNA-binding NarL/FixJ family response regulator
MLHNLKLSKRETEIVNLIAQAKCRKVIATELNIAVSTVDKHLHNIFLKTKTTSTQELMLWIISSK